MRESTTLFASVLEPLVGAEMTVTYRGRTPRGTPIVFRRRVRYRGEGGDGRLVFNTVATGIAHVVRPEDISSIEVAS